MGKDPFCCGSIFGFLPRGGGSRVPTSVVPSPATRVPSPALSNISKSHSGKGVEESKSKNAGRSSSAHPLDSIGCVSNTTIGWLSSLILLANSRQLEEEDFWQAPSMFDPEKLAATFWGGWKAEVEWSAKRNARIPSAGRAIVRAFWRENLSSGLAIGGFSIVNVMQPILITKLLNFLRSQGGEDVSIGLAYSVCLLVLSGCSSFLIANYSRLTRNIGVITKVGLSTAVFQHSLELSAAARLQGSVGQTTNLMAVDTEKFYMCSFLLHFVWMAPLQALIVCLLLAYYVGASAFVGLVVIFLLWVLQLKISRWGGLAAKRALGYTDERVKFITEVIRGIRVVKVCAWEVPVFNRAIEARKWETNWAATTLFCRAVTREIILILLPPILLAIIFGIQRARGMVFDEGTALTALGLINTLRFPLNLFASALALLQEARVSAERMGVFFRRPTRAKDQTRQDDLPLVEAKGAVFSWDMPGGPVNSTFCLQVDQLHLSGCRRVAVVGRVASGKSSLLAALLGEMGQQAGSYKLQGRVAFMGQTPWVQNATLRDNILFGHAFNLEAYEAALQAAALGPDLAQLLDGDVTEIGERGINLSGGQKARVGLARCLYAVAQRASNTLILDCPFDALDVHTGKSVCEGLMHVAKDALLICSMSAQVQLLSYFDTIIVMEDGKAAMIADLPTVAQRYPDLVAADGSAPAQERTLVAVAPSGPTAKAKRLSATHSGSALMKKDRGGNHSMPFRMLLRHIGSATNQGANAGAGFAISMILVVIFVGGQGCRIASDILFTSWACDLVDGDMAFMFFFLCASLMGLRVLSLIFVTQRSARALFRHTFWSVLRAPVVEYFDVTTSGEIVNKFAKDLETTDVTLPETIMQWLSNGSQILTIGLLAIAAINWFALVLGLLGVIFVIIANRFSAGSRNFKRLDGASRSPIYNSFSECLSGLETIRAWRAQDRYMAEFIRRQRHNLRFFHATSMSEAWVMARLESISFIIIGALAFAAVAMRETVEPRLVGLALVYIIQLTAMLQRTVQLTIMINQYMTSCERVQSFLDVKHEPCLELADDSRLPKGWPKGAVTYENLHVRYREGDLVLRGVSFHINPGERVGVCGRSGSGKSTLVSALFRIVSPAEGRILIDSVDISSIGLHRLRGSLSIIPQEPVIFSGTIRANIDPFGRITSDQALQETMRLVGLGDLLDKPQGLDAPVAEHGENLSQGQRQLLCIARAMAQQTRITCLDEATSAMDAETDQAVQAALANHWKVGGGTTLLTIAHRLATILDHDMILVMRAGEVIEFDTPQALRAKPDGTFAKMLDDRHE